MFHIRSALRTTQVGSYDPRICAIAFVDTTWNDDTVK